MLYTGVSPLIPETYATKEKMSHLSGVVDGVIFKMLKKYRTLTKICITFLLYRDILDKFSYLKNAFYFHR